VTSPEVGAAALAERVRPGEFVGVSVSRESIGIAIDGAAAGVTAAELAEIDEAVRPRWVIWDQSTADELVELGVRLSSCWDLAAVHRLAHGGWKASPTMVWAGACGLPVADAPEPVEPDLFTPEEPGDPNDPVRPDGHLRPGWFAEGAGRERVLRWALLAVEAARRTAERQWTRI